MAIVRNATWLHATTTASPKLHGSIELWSFLANVVVTTLIFHAHAIGLLSRWSNEN